jgi:cytochrome P450
VFSCIGQKFAMAEEKCVLAVVLKRVKMQANGPTPELLPALISRAENGIYMSVGPR